MSRDDDGVYEWQDVRLAWVAWQAAQPKWIECSNPPEDECSVLILDADNIVWTGIYFPTHGFEIDTEGCPGAFTRWMPLPNPPEE
ncbi:DUF551 domain-containing protein [Edwardsiella tarda]|uniref:DUF551 domain-containing protein n=1 Tax=Edwardsiella tarda TaxID=636 RepID=UPI003B97DAA9